MPEAIATTKRRFYQALDALNKPQPSLKPSIIPEVTSSNSNKRSSAVAAAFDEARDRARKRLRQSTSTTSLSTLDQRGSVISLPRPSQSKDNRPPPNFAPWSQESFLARLKTFSSVSRWYPKPDVINEVEWAKRGWVCVDLNTVQCKGGCGKRVVVSLDVSKKTRADQDEDDVEDEEKEAAALEEALSERYRSEIVEGHASSCMWHKAGCKDDIYRLPVVRPAIWQPELRKRCSSLQTIGESIKHLKTKPAEPSNEKLLKELPRDILDQDQPVDLTAFDIAMHGWRGSTDAGTQLLHCDACFQRIGLWMYQPDYKSGRKSFEIEEDEESGTIDLMEMHRDHCPWRNSESQKASGSLSGLNATQILQRVVSTSVRDHRRRSDEHATSVVPDTVQDEGVENPAVVESPAKLSREEINRQDKERESRIHKLKSLFSIKRRPTGKAPSKT